MNDDYLIEPDSAKTANPNSYQPKYTKRKYKKRPPFIKGPIDWKWLCSASKCNGKALQVALALHFLSGMKGDDTVKLPNKRMSEMGVSRSAKSRAIKKLEAEGLITVDRRQSQAPEITII